MNLKTPYKIKTFRKITLLQIIVTANLLFSAEINLPIMSENVILTAEHRYRPQCLFVTTGEFPIS